MKHPQEKQIKYRKKTKKKEGTNILPPAPKPFGSMDAVQRTPKAMTKGEKKAAQRAAQTRIASDSTYTYNALRNNPNSWMSKPGKGAYEAAANAAGRIARKNEAKRSAKKYSNGGQNPKKKKATVKGVPVDKLPEGRIAPYEKTMFDYLKKKKKKK